MKNIELWQDRNTVGNHHLDIVMLMIRMLKDAITFDDYDKEYKRIIKSLERYSYCSDCSYKNRFEKMKDIIKEKDEKSE